MHSKISIFFKSLLIGMVIIFSYSCTKDIIAPDPYVKPIPPEPPKPGELSYSKVIQPIFTSECVACHKTGSTAPDLTAGKSYTALMDMPGMVDTVNPGNSILYVKMYSGSMKVFCIQGSEADSVYKWISQGAKNN